MGLSNKSSRMRVRLQPGVVAWSFRTTQKGNAATFGLRARVSSMEKGLFPLALVLKPTHSPA